MSTSISEQGAARQHALHIPRLSELHTVHGQTNQAIARATDRNELFNDVCRIAVEHGGLRIAWIGMFDAAGLELIARASYGEGRECVRQCTERGKGGGTLTAAVRADKHRVSNEFERDPETPCWRSAAVEAGLRSAAMLPVRQGERVVGALGLFSDEAYFCDEEIVDVLKDMALDIGFALELGEQLAAPKLNFQILSRDPACRAERSRLADCLDLVETTLGQICSRSPDLRPCVLDDLGLVAPLQWCAGRQPERAHCTVSVEAASLPQRSSADVETAALRIVQEAVNDALRHAGAKRVAMSARVSEDWIVIKVRDDGCGFDVVPALARGHAGKAMGLLGMQERAGLLSGSLELKSSPGAGTEVIASLPLELAGA